MCWPWVACPTPAKPCLLTTPWKPFPFELPETSTNSPSVKWSTETESPRFNSVSKFWNSTSLYLAEDLDFEKWPASALFECLSLLSLKPNWTAE